MMAIMMMTVMKDDPDACFRIIQLPSHSSVAVISVAGRPSISHVLCLLRRRAIKYISQLCVVSGGARSEGASEQAEPVRIQLQHRRLAVQFHRCQLRDRHGFRRLLATPQRGTGDLGVLPPKLLVMLFAVTVFCGGCLILSVSAFLVRSFFFLFLCRVRWLQSLCVRTDCRPTHRHHLWRY